MARDASDLACLVLRLAADRGALEAAGASARRVVESHRGALKRTLGFMQGALSTSSSLGAPAGQATART